jgi:hypothetical protein
MCCVRMPAQTSRGGSYGAEPHHWGVAITWLFAAFRDLATLSAKPIVHSRCLVSFFSACEDAPAASPSWVQIGDRRDIVRRAARAVMPSAQARNRNATTSSQAAILAMAAQPSPRAQIGHTSHHRWTITWTPSITQCGPSTHTKPSVQRLVEHSRRLTRIHALPVRSALTSPTATSGSNASGRHSASPRRIRSRTLAIQQGEIEMPLISTGLTARLRTVPQRPATGLRSAVELSMLSTAESFEETGYSRDRQERRWRERTSTHWFADATRTAGAWVGNIAHHATNTRQEPQSGRNRRERPYMEMARMAREMERL